MKWSWKIGELAGIDLRLHATILLLLGWVLVSSWMTGKSVDALLAGIAFVVALLACAVFHELGHAIAARKFGIQTRDITLLPIGGVARLQRMAEKPGDELWFALAGPAVSLSIAVLLFCSLALTHRWEPFNRLGMTAGPFGERLFMANIWLVFFNLIPAFPMDGGHALRALLASRMSYPEATQLAASAGQGLALAFGFLGLFTSPILLFIGLFVWIGASQEAGAAQIKVALSGMPASAAMLTDFETLQCANTLADAVRATLRGSQNDFPVLDRDRVVGILTGADLLVALTDFGQDHPVTCVMRRDFLIAKPAEMLEIVFQRLRKFDCHTMPVVHKSRMAGLITMDKIGEYLLIEAGMHERGCSPGLVRRVFGNAGNRRNPQAAL